VEDWPAEGQTAIAITAAQTIAASPEPALLSICIMSFAHHRAKLTEMSGVGCAPTPIRNGPPQHHSALKRGEAVGNILPVISSNRIEGCTTSAYRLLARAAAQWLLSRLADLPPSAFGWM
jgi:hypothetical protein